MREIDELAGFVFEGAFKVGFLEKARPELIRGFKGHLFDFLRSEGLPQGIISELERPIQDWDKIGTDIRPETAQRIYVLATYMLGYYGGLLYAGDGKNIELEKVEMGEESADIVWRNADLVYRRNGTLYIVDFKLSGLLSWLKDVFDRGRVDNLPRLPVVNVGVPVSISLGELNFLNFVKNFVLLEEPLKELQDVFVELKGFSQLICYGVDYLTEMWTKDLRELCLELLYPAAEPLRTRFVVEPWDISKLSSYKQRAKEIYRELKSKEWAYEELDETVGQRAGKSKRLEKEALQDIQRYIEEMKQREKETIFIQTNPIQEARDDVKDRLNEFFNSQEDCKAIALLHSAGSGKTSTLRNLILNSQGKHIVLYMATRVSLIEKEKDQVEKSGADKVKVIYERKSYSENKYKRHTGQGYEDVEKKEGILKRTVEKILKAVDEKHLQIWSFSTIQAIVDTDYGNTSKHLEKLLRSKVVKNYHIHIILDEFYGYRNGLDAIQRMFDFVSKVKEKGGKAYLYLFDANGYSPELLERLMREFESYQVIPDSLVLCNYTPELKTAYKGIPLEIYAKHGYPASGLYINKKFMLDVELNDDGKVKLAELIGDYIIGNLQKKSTAFLYVQDKEMIAELRQYFDSKEVSNLYITASSRKSQRDINEGDQDVIMGTSAVSRGLDFSRPHKPVDRIFVVITDWGIEQNLVEIIQAISRARGDEKTENTPRYIHLIYMVQKEKDYTIEKLTQLVEYQDENLVRLLYKREHLKQKLQLDFVVQKIIEDFLKTPDRPVIVPVPAQHSTVYRMNRFSDLENIMQFLEDVYMMESSKDQELAKYIHFLVKEISSGISVYTNDVPKTFENIEYYHPYVLLWGTLHISFDNEKRKKAMFYFNKVKDKLNEHNEDKTRDIEYFLNEIATREVYGITFLIPVYAWVFTEHVLGNQGDHHLRFAISSRVGRGGADVLGGGLDITTSCKNIEGVKEYAIIPLGEDYPYKEVLSGRFAKFPIEFIYKLLEEG